MTSHLNHTFKVSNSLPLSQKDSMVKEVYNEVHMTHILHTAGLAMSIASCL